jgi:hypothetical protein
MKPSWTAEIMTDPMRNHRLHVELLEDGHFRGRLLEEEPGNLLLQVYTGRETTIPVQWLLDIAKTFKEDLEKVRSSR